MNGENDVVSQICHHLHQLEEGQRCYAVDNPGLVEVDSIFDPHRPYQNSSIQNHLALRFCTNWHSCTHCDLRKRDPLGVGVAVDVVAKRGFDVWPQNLLHGFG